MDNNNRRYQSEADKTGEIISWVIVFVLMFAFWPVGLLLLLRKLRGYTKPSGTQQKPTSTKATNDARKPGSTVHQDALQHKDYAKQANPNMSAGTSYTSAQSAKQQPAWRQTLRDKEKNRLEKKTGKFVSVILLLIAIGLFVIGANTITGAVRDITAEGPVRWGELGLGVFYFIGGFISFFSRNIGVRRFTRYKNYYAFVAERGIVPIPDIVRSAGLSTKAVTRDIQAMINAGYFGPGAYIDSELDSLVLYAEAAKEARLAAKAAQEVLTRVVEQPENQYMAIILELRELNDTIVDLSISDKIDRIEELTGKIFRIVEDNPAKLPQIRRFMNYYLPTTLKLLHSYATLEKQGIKGENITAAKENIGRILDTLATGYEQQLDQLFKSDAIDIAADINVLESLLHQDGLTGEKSEFKTMEGSM